MILSHIVDCAQFRFQSKGCSSQERDIFVWKTFERLAADSLGPAGRIIAAFFRGQECPRHKSPLLAQSAREKWGTRLLPSPTEMARLKACPDTNPFRP
jgi:hypothetical protein